MIAGRMTRRSLLAAGAGVVAGGLSHPGGVLAALAGPPETELRDRWLGTLQPGERTIELDRNADLLGLEWHAPADAHVQLRFRAPGGRWSSWCAAGATGHGPDRQQPAAPSRIVGEPVWSGGTTAIQLRASRALSGVRLHLLDVSGGVGAQRAARAAARSPLGRLAVAASLPLAESQLQAGPGQPPIIARRAWARGMAHPRVAPEYGAVQMAFVHHTENPNGYLAGEVPAMLRAIYAFHVFVNGWNDIGYNFVIDAFGRVFEARAGGIEEAVVGAHAGGYNLVSSGTAVLGSFMSTPISPAARRALQYLLAWKLALHGVPADGRVTVRVNPEGARFSRFPANARVSLPRIAGHRDADSTDCPGDVLYGELPAIRPVVKSLAPRPVSLTLAVIAPGATAPAPVGESTPVPGESTPVGGAAQHSEPASEGLTGVLSFLDSTPVGAASVAIQSRSVARRGEVVGEQTLAQAQTDAQGRWSLSVSLTPASRRGMWLRAVYSGAAAGAGGPAGAGAAVSAPLHVAVDSLSPVGAAQPTQPAGPAPAS
jgi:hypothetical protein